MPDSKRIEVVVSFDTTGSMYPCLSQVRRNVESMTTRLFRDVPGIKMGIIAHGDYCDWYEYVTKQQQLSQDKDLLCRFIRNVEKTGGGDLPECYELVLHEARSMGWTNAKSKVLVLIGDDVPHPPHYPQNKLHLDWRNELELLLAMGIHVYGVQALNRSHATPFYKEIARKTGGYHLTLDQFSTVTDLILAICYRQQGQEPLLQFEDEVLKAGRMNRGLDIAFGTLSGRKKPRSHFAAPRLLEAVPPERFQMLYVDSDQTIRDFERDQGLAFQKGRGFYEFTKKETIQENKEVVLVDRLTGDMYTGDAARRMIGAPPGERVRIKPTALKEYRIFVRSDSYNRILKGGTNFLYEVDMSR